MSYPSADMKSVYSTAQADWAYRGKRGRTCSIEKISWLFGWFVGVLWHINPFGLFNVNSWLYIYIYIYIYIVTVLVATNSLCGFMVNQVRYNLESAQYLWWSYYIIIMNKYIVNFIYSMPWKFLGIRYIKSNTYLYIYIIYIICKQSVCRKRFK